MTRFLRRKTVLKTNQIGPIEMANDTRTLMPSVAKPAVFRAKYYENSYSSHKENQADFQLEKLPGGVSKEDFKNEGFSEDAKKIYGYVAGIVELILKNKHKNK